MRRAFFSMHDWNDLWRSQQPFCEALAQQGEEILFVPCMLSLLKALNPRHGEERQKVGEWIRGTRRGLWQRIPAVSEFFPPPLWHLGSNFPCLVTSQVRAVGRLAEKQIRRGEGGRTIVWADHPFCWSLRAVFPSDVLVGYIIDDVSTYPHVNTGNMEQAERRLAREADLVVVVTRSLERRYAGYGANTLLQHNGAPTWVSRLAENPGARELHPALRGLQGPLIGYVGSVMDHVDLELLRQVVNRFADCTLVILGPVYIDTTLDAWREVVAHPRVVTRPAVPYGELGSCVAALDVCLLPYIKCPLMEGADPGKINTYLALGKPVVAVRINEDIERHADLIYLADSREEFLSGVELALSEPRDSGQREARQRRVLEHTWRHVASNVRETIRERFGV